MRRCKCSELFFAISENILRAHVEVVIRTAREIEREKRERGKRERTIG